MKIGFLQIWLMCISNSAAMLNFRADIRADSNRDGTVDISGDSDLFHKHEWSDTAGAVFLANIGDTDRRCSKLALAAPTPPSNEELAACNDASDDVQRAPQFMAPLLTVPLAEIRDSAVGHVSVDEQHAPVRIFRQEGYQWVLTSGSHKFTAAELRAGLNLGIDARDTRRPGQWDGRVTVRFDVQDGRRVSTDCVRLRVAPILSHHHGQHALEVFTTAGNYSGNPFQARFVTDIENTLDQAGLDYPLLQFSGSDDIWAQDFFEPAYTSMPGPGGKTTTLHVMIRSAQDDRVAGRQVFEYLRGTGRGAVQHLGGARDEINSMGNLETVPPYTLNGKSYPAGRVIMGTHGDTKPWIYNFIKAQEIQDPILLDTSWLGIGHVDEIVQFLPTTNGNSSQGSSWAILVPDPQAGLRILRSARESGRGSARAFSRHNNDTAKRLPIPGGLPGGVPNATIDGILADAHLISANEWFGERLESNIEILTRETGIQAPLIRRVPTVYTTGHIYAPGNGVLPSHNASATHAASLYPAAINGMVFSEHKLYLAPRQWGPVIDGRDILQEAVEKVYEELGYRVIYVDDWQSHHQWGGEVHCGTNTVREASGPWWKS